MTAEEYAQLDRIDSMILDQRENRKFSRYLFWYKGKIAETLSPVLNATGDDEWSEDMQTCHALDTVFRNILRQATRSKNTQDTYRPIHFTVLDAVNIAKKLKKEVANWRDKLHEDDNVVAPAPITPTEIFQPIKIK